MLARTGLAQTLRVLDLSDSAVQAQHITSNAKLFASLERLVLERTSVEDVRDLAALGPEIVHSHAPEAPTYRYVVGME